MSQIPVCPAQIQYICDLLDQPVVREFCNQTDFYRRFRSGIVYDIQRRRHITERQLYQIRKISDLTGQTWRLII